ncbi:MAG: hypothetical protein ACOY46_18920 [Bacillota bacterium]
MCCACIKKCPKNAER